MEDKIRAVLSEKVSPLLKSHAGGVDFMGYEDGVVHVRMTGACRGCPSAQYTVEEIIRSIVIGELPDVRDISLDASVSPDLIDMARKILRGD
ncbi:MAG: NifU family protein [Clostridiales Family XIII bacterium]|jgi:Fe-S cluster biogenesis protein NfuA|nr:NifU family protein [Clostridiales Family XIII bacterium]